MHRYGSTLAHALAVLCQCLVIPGRICHAGDAASEAGPSGSNDQEAHDQGLVDRIAQRSSPLWVALSECIGRIEAGLKTPGGAGDSPATSRVLPPGAAQVIALTPS